MTITELRNSKGLSQSQFAKLIGIPVGTLQNWEQGKRTPPTYVLDLIERVLQSEYARPIQCSECTEWGICEDKPDIDGAKFCSVHRIYTGGAYYCGDATKK